ncbi:SPX domain-containing protein [Mycena floridula]|nr:SPX domain-containing protein [Mycena floridula]
MHFAKTYAQLLLDLPPELSQKAIQYRELKKLINQVVLELASLGLSPDVLHHLLDDADTASGSPKLLYEVNDDSGRIEPILRVAIDEPPSARITTDSQENLVVEEKRALWSLWNRSLDNESSQPGQTVIPLAADSAFFQLLSTALQSFSDHLQVVKTEFTETLLTLSAKIGDSARPVSRASTSFRPLSSTVVHPGTISVPSIANKVSLVSAFIRTEPPQSDLYCWRELFQLYIEAEIFESVGEAHRGERSIEESEQRLRLFTERVCNEGFADPKKLKLDASREALQVFLELSLGILNVKKFQHANAEAARKILKKHTKRTALPLDPTVTHEQNLSLILSPLASSASLPRLLVQAIGEILLPVIPHIDDYSCLICTGIAFKPIRLKCGHLFCVRCLVKMQKRGQGDCPLCRAETVLIADRCDNFRASIACDKLTSPLANVDWALINFLKDWFPIEARAKLKQDEKEASHEQLLELGLDPDQKCTIM